MAFDNLKLDKLPRKYQWVLLAVLAAGLGLAGYSLWISDLVAERARLQNDIAVLEKAVAQASDVESKLDKFKAELAALDIQLDELRRILPSQKETPDVLRSVQLMAAESNLKIIKFAPQPVMSRSFYSDWPIAMDVEGSYNALGEFFEKIGRFRRIVNVDNINVKGIDGSLDPSRTLTSHCTATTFVYRNEQPAVAGK